jgi:hypothetical protein
MSRRPSASDFPTAFGTSTPREVEVSTAGIDPLVNGDAWVVVGATDELIARIRPVAASTPDSNDHGP